MIMTKSFDDEWERIHADRVWGMYPSESVIRFIARNYYKYDRKSIKILDFCCGSGSNTWYLAHEGFDVYAFDGSTSAIKRAKERFKEEGLQAHFEVKDALNCDYEDDFFDCIIDNVGVYANRYENIRKMYETIFLKLKYGGKLFTTSFSLNTTGYETGVEIEKNTYKGIKEGTLAGRGIAHLWEGNDLFELLRGVGFTNIKIDRMLWTDQGNTIEQLLVQCQK